MMTVIWQSMTTIIERTLMAGELMKDQVEPVRAIMIENINTLRMLRRLSLNGREYPTTLIYMQVTGIPIIKPKFGLLLSNVALSRYKKTTKMIEEEKKNSLLCLYGACIAS